MTFGFEGSRRLRRSKSRAFLCPMDSQPLQIAVLMGGVGRERDVSIQSGACAVQALVEAGYRAVAWDIRPDQAQVLDDPTVDVFFVALHGAFGEDGKLQQIMEQKGLTYTGSGPQACGLSFDKMAGKPCFAGVGIETPRALEFSEETDAQGFERDLNALGPRVVVKPIRQGSSVGVTILDASDRVLQACRQTLAEFGDCMVEQFIAGREITAGVLMGRALPVIEIRPVQGFYDYRAKYLDDQTQYLFDTLPATAEQSVQSQALACFNAMGLRHFARIDFILTPEGRAYALEANAIPGLTTHSLLPKAAAQAGISMSVLCSEVVRAAYRQRR